MTTSPTFPLTTSADDATPRSQVLAQWRSRDGTNGYEILRPCDGVILAAPWGAGNIEEVEIYARTLCGLIESSGPSGTVLILDYSRLTKARPEVRKIVITALNAIQPPVAGLVFVGLNPLFRLFIRLGRRMHNFPFPVEIRDLRSDGVDAAVRILSTSPSPVMPIPPAFRPMRQRWIPRALSRWIVRRLQESLADFPWDSKEKTPYPVPVGHPFHEIFEMWGVVKDDLDQKERERSRHEAELDDAIRALAESEHRYRAVFEASGAAMVIFDEDRKIRMANRAALRLSGLSRDRLEGGFDWTQLVHHEDLDRLLDYHARRVHDSAIPARYECRIIASGGRDRVAAVTVELVPGTTLRVASLDDLTETRHAEAEIKRLARDLERRVLERTAELEAANGKLAEALRSREEFLASMSHELRTPLASILNLSESLQAGVYGRLSSSQSKAVGTVSNNGQHLLDLITDILDLSKNHAGKLEIHKVAMSLSEAVQDAVALIGPGIRGRDITLEVDLDRENDQVQADPLRVRQMILNLLSNAIKFTPPGKRVGVLTRALLPERVSIEVWDEGIGIAPEDQSRLFQPFVQLDNRLSRSHAGTGLGLALTRTLVELHQGTITLQSEPGAGSRFLLELPRGIVDAPTSVAVSEPDSSHPQDSNLRILVIEDNDDLRGVLADYLEAAGHEVVASPGGEDGLRILREGDAFDAVLLDIQMPGMDGYQVLRQLRSSPLLADLPVIAMTGLAFEEDVRRCHEAGATMHVAKPLRMADLMKLLTKLGRAIPS
jgi:PAS domain S-box-containing protein